MTDQEMDELMAKIEAAIEETERLNTILTKRIEEEDNDA